MPRVSQIRSLLAGLAAFVGYGGWAYYVNAAHSLEAGMRSGLVQGGYSFCLTFVTTLLMEKLYRRVPPGPNKSVQVIAIISTGLFLVAYAINWLAGTPEILLTIAPGFLIGLVYTSAYVGILNKTIGTF